jgi:predicted RNase H-like HicB family nuclease
MSAKHKKPNKALDPARPFDPAVWAKAEAIAIRYGVTLRYLDDEKCFFGRGVELPMAMGDGQTEADCLKCTRKSLVLSVATMLEHGERPPLPAESGERTEQVNIRMTRAEKQAMEEAAGAGGFRSVSDYLRVKALSA